MPSVADKGERLVKAWVSRHDHDDTKEYSFVKPLLRASLCNPHHTHDYGKIHAFVDN